MDAGDVLLHQLVEVGGGQFDARQHFREGEVVERVVAAGVVDRRDLLREVEREVGVVLGSAICSGVTFSNDFAFASTFSQAALSRSVQ